MLIISKFDDILVDEPIEIGAFIRGLGYSINNYNTARNNLKGHDSKFIIVINCKYINDTNRAMLCKEIGDIIMISDHRDHGFAAGV